MENASKALIMAASVLIAIVIISAFVLMMSNLTSYQQRNYDVTLTAQVAEFNNQFTTYARDGIRGSEMISLMNKVLDYNTRYAGEEGFTEMLITITVSNQHRKKLSYDGTNRLITQDNYTQNNISSIVGQPTSVSGSNVVTGEVNSGPIREIEVLYQQKYCNQLAAEISNIEFIVNNSQDPVEEFNKENFLPESADYYYRSDSVNNIYKDALLYYEYIQFKRAYFDCVGEPEYDSNTGRILKMEFKCTGIGV